MYVEGVGFKTGRMKVKTEFSGSHGRVANKGPKSYWGAPRGGKDQRGASGGARKGEGKSYRIVSNPWERIPTRGPT